MWGLNQATGACRISEPEQALVAPGGFYATACKEAIMSEQTTLSYLPVQDGVEFRFIPDLIGYCVGDDGSLWSRYAKGTKLEQSVWRRLLQTYDRDGYRVTTLKLPSGKRKQFKIHQLILLAFVGPKPDGSECCHKNHIRYDNRLANLYWGTRLENHQESVLAGRVNRGSLHGQAKLHEDDIRIIRRRAADGEKNAVIAKSFGVSRRAISLIVSRIAWTHAI